MRVPIWNTEKWREENAKGNFPKRSAGGTLLIIGCNYHTKWQSNKSMRFVLTEIKGQKARLQTRQTGKDFWTNSDDLLFIESKHNKEKARNFCAKTNP